MNRVFTVTGALIAILCVSACGPTSLSRSPDYSNAPNSANSQPQSPSSLPPGALINGAYTPSTGTILRSGY